MGEQSKTVGQPWHTCEETSECTACDDAVNPRKAAAFAMGWLSNVLAEGLGERGWQLAEPKIRDVLRFIESAAAPKVEREGLLSTSDLADLERLNEVFEDGQGWDIPKERMKRLAELGAVRWHGRTRYSITAFGMLCLGEGETPLRTVEEANAAAHARMLARNGIPAPAHGERRGQDQ